MGGRGSYLSQGGFSKQEYETVKEINGIKIIERIDKHRTHNTPFHSNTSNVYATYDEKKQLKQIAVYENRQKVKDIEWNHSHDDFIKGEIHVQEYDKFGNRSKIARNPTEEELNLVKRLNLSVRLNKDNKYEVDNEN